MLTLDSGTHLGEALAIENEQIDLLNQSILLSGEKTKNNKVRTVFFTFSHRQAAGQPLWLNG